MKSWENEYSYRRLLEILKAYWLDNPDEYKVRICMDFMKADGQIQSKCIVWKNPHYYEKGKKTKASLTDYIASTSDYKQRNKDEWWEHGEIRKYAKYKKEGADG